MVSRGSLPQQGPDYDDEDARISEMLQAGRSVAFKPGVQDSDTAGGFNAHLTVRPGMWSDVCLRLRCPKDTPVKVLKMSDLNEKKSDKILDELSSIDQLVVIMPDRQNNIVWQTLWHYTQKKYFYHPHASLLGVSTWSHWALLVDWNKRIKYDDVLKPGREYDAAEADLEGKLQRTSSSRRKYRRQHSKSHEGRVAHGL